MSEPTRLRSVDQITGAYERLADQQMAGKIDPLAARALNTTLAAATYLGVKLRVQVAQLHLQAQRIRGAVPEGVLPVLPPAE